jgi:hypothetical protein
LGEGSYCDMIDEPLAKVGEFPNKSFLTQ